MSGTKDRPGSRACDGSQGSIVGAGPRQKADREVAQGRNSGDVKQAVAMGLGILRRHLGSSTCRAWTQK